MKGRIPLYNLNNFLRFEKKIYQAFGHSLGRAIPLKAILYVLVIGVVELVLYFTPVINITVRWIPPGILIVLPFALAYLLNDVGTEDRKPVSFFNSFIRYNIRRVLGYSFFRNREVQKGNEYTFINYVTVADELQTEILDKDELEEVLVEREKALRYMERINDPDGYFEGLRKKEEEERKLINRMKRFFKRLFKREGR